MDRKQSVLTERLELREFSEDDKESMLSILCNDSIKETYMIPDFGSKEEAEKLFRKIMSFSKSKEHFYYGIYLKNTLIGFINECCKEEKTMLFTLISEETAMLPKR